MTTCPACDSSVDPLRSRFVGVRDGKVVAYCSAECAAGQPCASAARVMSPASGVPVRVKTPPAGLPAPGGSPDGPPDGLAGGSVDSGPVIEVLHEPASGVVTSAPDRRVERRARHPDEIPIAAFWAADLAEKAEKERLAAARAGAPPPWDARRGHDAVAGAPRDPAERTGRDPAESSDGSGQRAAATADAARREPGKRSGRDSAEASDGPGQRAAATADAARREPGQRPGRDPAESSDGSGQRPAARADAARREPGERAGRDSAESSDQPGERAAAATARREPGESAGRESAESSDGPGQRAAAATDAARREPGRDSAESSDEQGRRTAAATARREPGESAGRESAESSDGPGQRAAATADAARREPGRESAESSDEQGRRAAAATARREPGESAGRQSAESSDRPGQRAAATADAARREPAEHAGRESAESSDGPDRRAAADAARREPGERPGGESAESSDGPDRRAAADAARREPGERPGGDSAESWDGPGRRASAAAAAGREPGERAGGDSAESLDGPGRRASAAAAAGREPGERVGRDSAESSDGPGRRAAAATAGREPGERAGRESAESSGGQRSQADAAVAARDGRSSPDPSESRRRWPLVVLILVLLGAGAGLLYYFFGGLSGRGAGRDGHAAGSVRGTPSAAAVAPAARAELSRPIRPSQAAAPPVVDPAGAVEMARAALRRDLAATSPRVQRLAAAALARTQDPEARELLAAQIGLRNAGAGAVVARSGGEADELAGNDIARLDLAYALARGGDRRGAEVLARALGAPRGEARDEAARLLAQLGDPRAVPHLRDLLAVEQRRLGAAEHLARLAEPRALQVLDHVRGDPRASTDDKARATVALGTAGRSAVAGALRDMLGDPHFNAFAAAALAAQGDRAARPVLERQLASPPLRVFAARALRQLEPAIDPRPLLPTLLDVVRAGRDIDRIPAAEAILLLAGPASWSAYD
jgi:hypothetical protein